MKSHLNEVTSCMNGENISGATDDDPEENSKDIANKVEKNISDDGEDRNSQENRNGGDEGGKIEEIDEDGDSEGGTDEDDNEPPLLKYTRINKLPGNFFNRDSISACLFHDKIFAFGTHSGLLHLTKPDFAPIQTLKCHRSSILSIYTDGVYFATASIDGTVTIGMIEDASNIMAFDFKRPVHAVVLDNDYKTSKTFVSGGMAGEVILSQRNWLGSRVDIILAREQGPIVGIHTVDDIILWMNDAGITFCGIHSKAQLLNVPYPQDGNVDVRPDLYRPHVHCPEVDRIIVGWGNHIWMFKVSLTRSGEQNKNLGSILSSAASSLRAAPDKKVELEHHFTIKMRLAGISSFKDDQLMCLGFSNEEDAPLSNIPELKILDTITGDEIHNDEVVSKNYENLTLNDYHLGKHIDNSSPEYFLISASDAIRIQILTLEDHYQWYLKRENFFKAWEIGKYVVDCYERLETGLKSVDFFIQHELWENAASNAEIIIANTDFGDDETFRKFGLKHYEDAFMKILRSGNVDAAVRHLPLEPQLHKYVYDFILEYYLDKAKLEEFLSCLQKWPLKLFSVQHFEDRLEELIERHDSSEDTYRDAIIHLYLIEGRYTKLVPHMLKRKDTRVLNVFMSHNLISQFTEDIVEIVLLPYNSTLENLPKLSLKEAHSFFDKPVEILVQNRHSLHISDMVKLFSEPKELHIILFIYLKKISYVDPFSAAPFENEMIELFSEYQRSGLLKFLKTKSNYDVERAIYLCSKEHGFHNELIYLWGKIGENKKALSLIIDELNDPKLAIEFVKNWGDSELWDFMVSYSMDKPKFVKALLDSPDEFGKTYLEVIKAMPADMEIEGLKTTIKRIAKDNALGSRVSKSVLKIIDDEANECAIEFLKIRAMGKVFHVNDHE